MNKQNIEEIGANLENKLKKKDKRKQVKMKISGSGVKKLQMLIKKKNEK